MARSVEKPVAVSGGADGHSLRLLPQNSANHSENLGSTLTIVAESGHAIELLGANFLLRAEFVRDGDDLIIVGPGNASILIVGYFSLESPPPIIGANGICLSSDVLEGLSRHPGEKAYAQEGTSDAISGEQAVGRVETIEGSAVAIRVDGSRVELTGASNLYQGDIIETAEGGTLSILLADGTIVSMDSDARLVINEFVFSPDQGTGKVDLFAADGVFMFSGGEVASLGDQAMTIQTPRAVAGVRGTTVGVQIDVSIDDERFFLLPDPCADGNYICRSDDPARYGTIFLTSKLTGATSVLNQPLDVIGISAAGTWSAIALSPAQILDVMGDVARIGGNPIGVEFERDGLVSDAIDDTSWLTPTVQSAPVNIEQGQGVPGNRPVNDSQAASDLASIAPAAGSEVGPVLQDTLPIIDVTGGFDFAASIIVGESLFDNLDLDETFDAAPTGPVTSTIPTAAIDPGQVAPTLSSSPPAPDTGTDHDDGPVATAPTSTGAVNDPPTAVGFANATISLAENTDTTAGVKVADIVVTDDALGTETLALVGADAGFFEIVGSELRLKAGVLDFETKSSYSVQVTADDPTVGGDPDATSTTFTINVLSESSNQGPTAVTLVNVVAAINDNANTTVGVKVADIVVTDDAFGAETLALVGADSGFFEIVGSELRLKAGVLDFETKSSYSVQVTADDLTVGGNPDATSATFTVTVTDLNEAPIAPADFSASAAENVSDTTVLATVIGLDPDVGGGNDGLNDFENLSYAITSDPSGKFEINATTGAISLKPGQSLDLETATSHVVTVRVSDGSGLFDDVNVTINVTDANEPPTAVGFANTTTSLAENTNTTAGVKVADIVVTDDALGTETLSLVGADAGFFEIVGSELRLKAGVLDFETKSSYSVQVTANDSTIGGNPDATSATFTVTVTDLNEAPIAPADFSVSAAENVSDTTVLATVIGTDPDAGGGNDGLNNFENLSYTITSDPSGKFEIDATTGAVSLKPGQSLDFETATSHVVTVRASDGPGLFDDVNVTVNVTNGNDAPTAVGFANTTTLFDENTDTTAGVKVADIVVTDDALGSETLALVGADAGFFEIVGSELRLKAGVLDFETKNSYSVQVTADDATVGGSPDATSATFTVTVSDVNEAPTAVGFTNTTTSLAENTNTTAGVKVADIVVTDDALGTETLALVGADAGFFEIVGSELRLKAGVLDFETKSSYSVQVTANDPTVGGNPDATSTIFTINVFSEGSNQAPTAVTFVNATTAINDNTNTTAGVKVADVVVTDDALGTNTLSLIGADAGFFEIVGSELRLKAGVLDFETKNSYSVQVTADDATVGGSPDATSATFTVTVSDVNEAPTAPADFSVSAAENVSDTAVLATVIGSDPDVGGGNDGLNNFENLSYAITSDPSGKFEIDATTGAISLKPGQSLDFETATSHVVTVRVSDGPGLFDDVNVTINVTDANEPPTAVGFANTTTSVAENTNTTAGVKVADIVVTDDALGSETLALVGADAGFFEIVGNELRLKAGVLDFETKSSYSIQVAANDPTVGGNPDATSATFTVTVSDVNEAPTAVGFANTTTSVAENTNTTAGVKVADIVVTDDALGVETLSLVGADAGFFEIVGSELRLKAGVLDFETKSSYSIQVAANDPTVGGNPDATSATFTVTVSDVNETPTAVAFLNTTALFDENTDTTAGVKVADIVVTDDALGTETLALVGADAGFFEIVGSELRLKAGVLDFETKSSYSIQVTANDPTVGGNPDATSATFTVNVANLNEIIGDGGDNSLAGTAGRDFLSGGAGNDLLDGKAGNDSLIGGVGNDTFVYVKGDGNDVIVDEAGADVISFDNGAFTVNMARDGGDLLFINADGSIIRIVDHFNGKPVETQLRENTANPGNLGADERLNLRTDFVGTAGTDVFVGTDAADVLTVEGGDQVFTNGGNDIVRLTGLAFVVPGTGNDTIELLDPQSPRVFLGYMERSDPGVFNAATGVIAFGAETDTVTVGNNFFFGTQGADTFIGSNSLTADLFFEGAGGNDQFQGGLGFETVGYLFALEGVTVNLGAGTAVGGASVGTDTLINIDGVSGSRFNDTLVGSAGNNFLRGYLGNDVLQGGAGNDNYFYELGEGSDTVTDTGGSSDSLSTGTRDLPAELTRDGSDLLIRMLDGAIIRVVGHFSGQKIEFFNGTTVLDGFIGTSGPDTIVGTAAGETINGGGGADFLFGGAGNDTIFSGGSNGQFDVVVGGRGNDTLSGDPNDFSDELYYYDAPVGVVFNLNGAGSSTATMGSEVDTFTSFEDIYGSPFADIFNGDNSGSGAFWFLEGGGGNDTFIGGTAQETIGYFFALGSVSVDLALGTASGDESVGVDSFSNIENALGSRYGDVIFGNEGNNFLGGGGTADSNNPSNIDGDDTIDGRGGNDVIRGDRGNDQLLGGAGNDTYIYRFGDGNDTIFDSSGNDTLSFDNPNVTVDYRREGNDLVVVNVDGSTIRIVDHFNGHAIESLLRENTTDGRNPGADMTFNLLAGLVGTANPDIFAGDNSNHTLAVGEGDLVFLGSGNDVVTATGLVFVGPGAGNDVINLVGDQAVGQSAGVLYLERSDPGVFNAGTGVITFGSETDTVTVGNFLYFGTQGADTFIGNASVSMFFEGAGGNDVMQGSTNFETVGYLNAREKVTVNLGAGTAVGGASVGTDTLTNIDGVVGSLFDDTLIGSSGNNFIRGYLGNDVLQGGAGDDNYFYELGEGNDTISDSGGTFDNFSTGRRDDPAEMVRDGNDLLIRMQDGATVRVTNHFAGQRIEALNGIPILTGLTGTAGSDVIIGTSGNDTINGGGGFDYLFGGAGNDTISAGDSDNSFDYVVGGRGNDTLIGDPNDFTDEVFFFDSPVGGIFNLNGAGASTVVLGTEVDTFTSFEDIYGTSFNDTFNGDNSGSGAFWFLEGSGGNDQFNGGSAQEMIGYFFARDAVTIDLAGGFTAGGPTVGFDTFNNIEHAFGSRFGDNIFGDENNNSLIGGGGNNPANDDGNDFIDGRGGDDFIQGDRGDDQLFGGFGSDTYFYRLGDGSDTINDVNGTSDIFRFNSFIETPLAIVRDGNDIVLTMNRGASVRFVNHLLAASKIEGAGPFNNFFLDGVTGTTGNDIVVGTNGSDTITGGDGFDWLFGGAGNDQITAGAGFFDYIVGGRGNDTIVGNLGDFDQVHYRDAPVGAVFNIGAGTVTLGAEVDTVTGIQEFYGTDQSDTFQGLNGNSIPGLLLYEGAGGNDSIVGGTNTFEGIGFVYAEEKVNVDMALGQAVGGASVGTDTFSGIENAFGSIFNDTIRGDGGANILVGKGGNDIVDGRAGDDQIWSEFGDGNDTYDGGLGNDTLLFNTFFGASVGVSFDLSNTGGQFNVDYGFDQAINIENLIGTFFSDDLAGNGNVNTLTGGGGADVLTGGAGADRFRFVAPSDGAAASNGQTGQTTGDFITDFVSGADKIQVVNSAFGLGATVGSAAGRFQVVSGYNGNNSAQNGQAHFVFDPTVNTLYFENDSAQAGYTVIATTSGSVTANDIEIVNPT